MPNIKSAKKRVLVNDKKSMQNQMIVSEIKTSVKKFSKAVEAKDATVANELLRATVSLIDSAASKGVYNKSYASRKQAQLYKTLNTLNK
ncbi:MAG: 30S ribosomal protein S20 [Clostridia bacterium]